MIDFSGGDFDFNVAGGVALGVNADGSVDVLNGLSVGGKAVDFQGLACASTIKTEEGNSWNLGGVNTGTITPDRKIAVEIDGQWYTLAAQVGLV